MDCMDARTHLVGHLRGRLPPGDRERVESHLASCESCRRVEGAERSLDDLLERELPRHRASAALSARLEHMASATPRESPAPALQARGRSWRLAPVALVAAMALAVMGLLVARQPSRAEVARAAVVSEALGDHLRVLADERGLVLASSESHQVKPWFQGRLDFAPVVPVPEIADLRLRGGAVGYFLDRKAAVVGYTLRRHAVTLLAFRPDGLPLSESGPSGGGGRPLATSSRGFRVATWQAGGIGYALVSDVAPEELDALATAFVPLTAR